MAIIGQGRVGIRSIAAPSTSTLWNNLKAYYTGDNTPNDAKGTYNGTLVNGTTYGTGKINNGFNLDGVNDYVSMSPSLGTSFSSPTSAHSYSAWIYYSAGGQHAVIIQNGYSGGGTLMVLYYGSLALYYKGGYNLLNPGIGVTTNEWHHVVVTYNGSGEFKFYLDNVLRSTNTGVTWTDLAGTCGTWVGSNNGTGLFFNGKIDEVGAWDKALTATEVTELYNAGNGKQYPN